MLTTKTQLKMKTETKRSKEEKHKKTKKQRIEKGSSSSFTPSLRGQAACKMTTPVSRVRHFDCAYFERSLKNL